MTLMGLMKDDVFVMDGQILFGQDDLVRVTPERRRQINGNDLSIIYQEPMTSLNPLIKIGRQVGEPLRLHRKDLSDAEIDRMVLELLTEVGIQNPGQIMKSYPHQLSGGMRQRVMIAMASICRPKILVADEPTTALDVTTQAHVLSLLKRVNEEFGTTILFISHDLGVINRVCDRVLIMYAGKIVERGKTRDILNHPAHQYTKGLIRSIPTREQKGKDLICIPGRVPSTMDPREPCPFAPRCGHTMEVCRQTFPECRELAKDHIVYCHMFD